MGYADKLDALRKAADVEGAFELLEGIFTAEGNQKIKGSPTDYLHDDEDDIIAPAAGFAQVVEGFKPELEPRAKVDRLFEWTADELEEGDELAALFKPFNCLRFQIGDYERCDAIINSGHLNLETGAFDPLYGWNHTFIDDEDSGEDYDFVYELENGDQYRFEFEGEEIPGKRLYYDLKVTLFSRFLLECAKAFFEHERFAALPKALPFVFQIQSAEYSDDPWAFDLVRITEADLANNPLAGTHRASLASTAEPTDEQRYQFYLRYANDPGAAEFGALVELCSRHRASFDALLGRAQEALSAGQLRGVGVSSRVLWRLAPVHPEEVVGFHERVLGLEVPDLSPDPERPRESALSAALSAASGHLDLLAGTWAGVPDDFRGRLQGAWDQALQRLAAVDHPVVRILLEELRLAGDEVEEAARGVSVPKRPSQDYLQALTACVGLMLGPRHGYGGHWDFLMERLKALGAKAACAGPALVAYLEEHSQERVDEQFASMVGEVIFALGVEDVPEAVHSGYKRNQFMFEYYKQWVRMAPDKALARFLEAYDREPDRFDDPAAWEDALYDSEFGYGLFAGALREHQEAKGTLDRVLAAAGKGPGPKLTRLLFALAAEAAKKKVQDYPLVVRLLEPVPDLDEDHAADLRYARLAVLLGQVLAEDEQAGAEIARLADLYPDEPLVAYLDVLHKVDAEGVAEAMRAFVAHMRRLTADDLVYRKAFNAFCGDPDGDFSPDPAAAYGVFRVCQEFFEKRNLTAGKFDGTGRNFRADPIYYSMYHDLGKLEAAERAELIGRYAEEYDFLDGAADLGTEQLRARLDPGAWTVALAAARRLLARGADENIEPLVALFSRAGEDEAKAEQLSRMLWPHEAFRDPLLKNQAFQEHLPAFVRHYPQRTDELAREIIERLNRLGLTGAVTRLAPALSAQTAMAIFKPLLDAFIQTADLTGAQALLRGLVEQMNPKKPEWVLVMSNLGVMHVLAGQHADAEQVFDALFAQDFSRFEYREGERDEIMEAVMGGSLDKQLSQAFWTYYHQARFNQACLYALTDRPDQAMASLTRATEKGHYTADRLLAEGDFASLRQRPDFQALIGQLMEAQS